MGNASRQPESAANDSSWRRPGAVLLVSCYELGHQPHGITLPKAFLERAGFAPATMDLAVEPFDVAKVERARFVAISVPMHTAMRIGEGVARRIRDLRRNAHICFHGSYAVLHAEHLGAGLADSVLGGELEQRLVELVQSLELTALAGANVDRSSAALTNRAAASVQRSAGQQATESAVSVLDGLDFPVPSRAAVPALQHYAHLVHGDKHVVAGYTEASRGCLHRCRHCPLPALYDGRLFIVPQDVVLEDIRNQVRFGARHITFGDADFLNGPAHALRVARAVHEEFPDVTFDYTAKVEHVLKHAKVVCQLGELGAVFMVSAVEILNDRILEILDKNHTHRDVTEALQITHDAGSPMRPSLMPFTPWTTRDDMVELLDWVEAEELVDSVDPVHYTIRLLVPPGSLLLKHPEMQEHIGDFDRKHLTYRWQHPDAQMDALQEELAQLVEESTTRGDDVHKTFNLVRDRVDSVLQVPSDRRRNATRQQPRRRYQRPPRLTESWFC